MDQEVFDRWVKKTIKVHLSGSNLNAGYPTANWIAVDYLSLTDEELETYNKFKEDYNEEVLRELEQIAIMSYIFMLVLRKIMKLSGSYILRGKIKWVGIRNII